jgi:hypothetical protein
MHRNWQHDGRALRLQEVLLFSTPLVMMQVALPLLLV